MRLDRKKDIEGTVFLECCWRAVVGAKSEVIDAGHRQPVVVRDAGQRQKVHAKSEILFRLADQPDPAAAWDSARRECPERRLGFRTRETLQQIESAGKEFERAVADGGEAIERGEYSTRNSFWIAKTGTVSTFANVMQGENH